MSKSKSRDADSVRILTYNCWGLKYVSKLRAQRIRAIASQLQLRAASGLDIIALQEVWVEGDFEVLRHHIQQELPYYKFFRTGMIAGPGLAVFSRWPITHVSVRTFPLNGRPSAVHRGDWLVGKSVASVVISHPVRPVEIFNAHLHAPYGPGDASYTCHRTSQAWIMAHEIRRAVACGHAVFAMGDLNSVPGSATHRLFELVGGLTDSWMALHGDDAGPMGELTALEQVAQAGVTCDSLLNTWRQKNAPADAKRLDYIFFDPAAAEVTGSVVTMTDRALDPPVSLSDHFGVESTFRLMSAGQSGARSARSVDTAVSTNDDLHQLFSDILAMINQYKHTARTQAKVRLAHFWLSVVAVVALHVGVWWVPAGYAPFLMMLGSVAIGVTGTIDGLIGFLFGRLEWRALAEFEDQVAMHNKF